MISQVVGLRSWNDGVTLTEMISGTDLGEIGGLHFEYVNWRCLR